VYTPVQLAFKYLHYWLTASNGKGHGIHSPFVFEFTESVLNDRNLPASWSLIEAQRKKLLQDKRIIQVEDLGAGSSRLTSTQRSIASIADSSLKSPKYARLLARIVNHYSCKNVLELGTSLGITSSYLATAHPEVRLTTLEGINAIADTAQSVFNSLQLNNIKLVRGDFDRTLEIV
jgi:tRNA G46 methylase TrmB